ncbi:hypothetical protein WN944_015932 [Citrus x changshan-huyou]|uniref:CCHC-type domain-containing protein n=1 Tax=Citrus x changshan-huyou TaxID=2935761 RepID=A0AAP0QN25_9ROSI
MDTEELIRRCKSISLEEAEGNKFSFKGRVKEKGAQIAAECLVGKVLHTRSINTEGLRTALNQVWQAKKEVKIENLGDNIFIFKFGNEVDKKRILAGGPWHFNQSLIVLKEPNGIGEITAQSFTHVSFWVQLKNVPIMCMEEEICTGIGELVGKVEEVDTDKAGDCMGQIIRMRIWVDITQPLKKILFIETEEGRKIPVAVEYEKLPDFCYCCGCLGHSYNECPKYKGQPKKDLDYGPWLKAMNWGDIAKQNRFKDRWMPRMNKENGEEIQKEGKQLTSPWKHTQSLLNEPESQNRNSAEPNQKKPDEENQHRLDNLNPIGAEHLMKDGETLKTGKSSNQTPESTAGKEKGFGDGKIKAGKFGEKQKEGKQGNEGNLQEKKEKAGNVIKNETMAIGKELGQTLA